MIVDREVRVALSFIHKTNKKGESTRDRRDFDTPTNKPPEHVLPF